jgi:hypothetical protein
MRKQSLLQAKPAITKANAKAGPAWLWAAIPVNVKIPPPMMAPIPNEVKPQRVNTRFKSFFFASA